MVKGVTSNLDIADASLQWRMTRGKDLGIDFVAEKNITPFFKASKIKKATKKAAESFGELSLNDLENDAEQADMMS